MTRRVPVYKLKDDAGKFNREPFMNQNCKKIVKNDNVYRVGEIVRKRKRNSAVEYLVKWKGYEDPKFNSCVSERDISKL